MAFFIKNFETITASLIQAVSQGTKALTDFNIGSKNRTLLEAFAQELEFYYYTMMRGIMEGIQSAVDNSFDFPRLPASSASGKVVFSLVEYPAGNPMAPTTDMTIPAGFKVQIPYDLAITSSASPGTSYSVLNPVIWSAGQTSCVATVVCDFAGEGGNTVGNSIKELVDTLPFIQGGEYKVSNPVAFVNGEDQESETAHKQRFARYLQSLSRGTLVALESSALTAVVKNADGTIRERVAKAIAVEPFMVDGSMAVGHADVYIYNGVGDTSAELVQAAQKIIDGYTDENNNRIAGYKSAGIIVSVLAAKEQPENFKVRVKWMPGYTTTTDAINSISASIARYISTLNPGDTVVYNKIIELVMAWPGIYNCIVESPMGDIAAADPRTIITVGDIQFVDDSEFTILNETYNT